MYGVNVDPIPPKDGIQIIQFLSKLGHYMLPDGKDVYESTTCMIDAVAEDIKSHIGEISKFDKVDLAIASMIIPVPPSLMLANELMTDISEDDMDKACYQLIAKTDFFKIYGKNREEEIKKTNFAIEIIWHYMKEVAGKEGVTGEQFSEKFMEIQTQLRADIDIENKCCSCGQSCELDFGKLIIF